MEAGPWGPLLPSRPGGPQAPRRPSPYSPWIEPCVLRAAVTEDGTQVGTLRGSRCLPRSRHSSADCHFRASPPPMPGILFPSARLKKSPHKPLKAGAEPPCLYPQLPCLACTVPGKCCHGPQSTELLGEHGPHRPSPCCRVSHRLGALGQHSWDRVWGFKAALQSQGRVACRPGRGDRESVVGTTS